MQTDLDGLRANLPRRYMKPFTRVRVLDPKQFLRQAGAELSMKPADVVQRNRLGLCVLSRIDLLLHFDVRHRFELQISFLRFGGVLLGESPFNVTGQRIVAFDQVRIVAIH